MYIIHCIIPVYWSNIHVYVQGKAGISCTQQAVLHIHVHCIYCCTLNVPTSYYTTVTNINLDGVNSPACESPGLVVGLLATAGGGLLGLDDTGGGPALTELILLDPLGSGGVSNDGILYRLSCVSID